MTPKEPTDDECSRRALVYEDATDRHYAIWYPQMGGYVGKAVVVVLRERVEFVRGESGGCVDVWVWHDGEFPLRGEDGYQPVHLHHCNGAQFVAFGEALLAMRAAQDVRQSE
jgi:hypothetical protein